MSAVPNVRIELDRSPPRFEPGETLAGTVHLSLPDTESGLEIREVWIRVAYRTPGQGRTDVGGKERVVLDSERRRLEPAEERSYRFDVPAPEGPPTQKGELFAVEWIVQAVADLPGFGQDASTSETFELVDTVVPAAVRAEPSQPKGEIRYVRLTDVPEEEADRIRSIPAVEWMPTDTSSEKRLRWFRSQGPRVQGCLKTCWGCSWLPFLLIPLMPLLVGVGMLRDGSYGLGSALMLVGLGISALWLYFADRRSGGGIRRWFSERVFGTFSLKAALDDLRRGGPIVWFVQLEPRRSVSVRRAIARLELEEQISAKPRQTGESSPTIRRTFGVHTFTLDDALEVSRGEEVLLAGNLTLPASWPASLYGRNSEFRWTLHVDLELDSGPDWHGQVRLDVR